MVLREHRAVARRFVGRCCGRRWEGHWYRGERVERGGGSKEKVAVVQQTMEQVAAEQRMRKQVVERWMTKLPKAASSQQITVMSPSGDSSTELCSASNPSMFRVGRRLDGSGDGSREGGVAPSRSSRAAIHLRWLPLRERERVKGKVVKYFYCLPSDMRGPFRFVYILVPRKCHVR